MAINDTVTVEIIFVEGPLQLLHLLLRQTVIHGDDRGENLRKKKKKETRRKWNKK